MSSFSTADCFTGEFWANWILTAARLANSRWSWSILSSILSASSSPSRRLTVSCPSLSHWSQMRYKKEKQLQVEFRSFHGIKHNSTNNILSGNSKNIMWGLWILLNTIPSIQFSSLQNSSYMLGKDICASVYLSDSPTPRKAIWLPTKRL